MRDSEVLMLSGSDFFHTWGAACPSDCNPQEVVVNCGRFNFRVPLRLYAVAHSFSSDLRYGGVIP